jgi:uncharacterized membrane protein
MLKYLISAIILVILDITYLTTAQSFFNNQIKSIQGSPLIPKIIPTSITYIILLFGLSYFILQKNATAQDAAILGFFIYSVYELTNYAIFKDWSLSMVFLDILWGTFLFGSTTWLTYFLLNLFGLKK